MPDSQKRFRSSLWSILSIIIIIVLAAEVIYLMKQNRDLRAALNNPEERFETLHPGSKVPNLVGHDLDGQEVKIGYPFDRPTFLIWFSTECDACHDNFPFWEQIYGAYGADRLRFVAGTFGEINQLKDFLASNPLKFPVLNVADQSFIRKYRVEAIPQTVLIDRSGEVKGLWPGILSATQKEQLETLIKGAI